MLIVRTCGSGTFHNDDRLQLLKQMIEYHTQYELSKKIFKLHDHKGCLNVYWLINPSKQDKMYLESIWEACCECELTHYVSTFNELSYGL